MFRTYEDELRELMGPGAYQVAVEHCEGLLAAAAALAGRPGSPGGADQAGPSGDAGRRGAGVNTLPDGIRPSPNIWNDPETYEIENRGIHHGRIEAAMRSVRDWSGADVLDIGCGNGYHLPAFARTARRVTGVEPYPPLLAAAHRRLARWSTAVSGIGCRCGRAPRRTCRFPRAAPTWPRRAGRTSSDPVASRGWPNWSG